MRYKTFMTIVSAMLAVVILWVGYTVLVGGNAEQKQALQQAEAYEVPVGSVCAAVMTPARHRASGATYTFPSSCLAPDWTASK